MSVPRSNISWCDFSGGDANFVIRGQRGDCECSPGCANCYAGAILERFGSGPQTTTFYPEKLDRLVANPLRENGKPFRRGPGSRPLVFACDMGDWLHPNISDDLAREIVARLAIRCDVDWLLLTKRAERLPALGIDFPANVWPGVTVEDQGQTGRIGELLEVNASVKWLSVEPMLGLTDLRLMPGRRVVVCPGCGSERWQGIGPCSVCGALAPRGLSWVVCGGESGPNRRHFDPRWAMDVRDQCRHAGVPFFFKQGSGLKPGSDAVLDGREWREFPK